MDIKNSLQTIIDTAEREHTNGNNIWVKDILFFANDALKEYKTEISVLDDTFTVLENHFKELSDFFKNFCREK